MTQPRIDSFGVAFAAAWAETEHRERHAILGVP